MKPTHFPHLIIFGLALLFGMQQLHAYNGPISGPKVKKVSFSGDDYHELKSDDGETTFKAPHWTAAEGSTESQKLPIAYTKGSTPKVKMEFKIDFEILEGQTLDVKVKAEGTDDINFPEKTITLEPGKSIYTYTEQDSDGSWPDTIKYYPPTGAFTLTWKFNIMGTEYTDDTKNRAYVTAAAPTCTTFHETLFYYACHNPSGNAGTDGKAVTHLIYQDFATKAMARINGDTGELDGANMTFYPGGPNASVVKDGTGVCASWAFFFQDVLKVHNYASEIIDLGASHIKFSDGKMHAGSGWIPKGNPKIIMGQCLAGQGPGTSNNSWQAHTVVGAFQEYYDPSYGVGSAASKALFEDACIGWYYYSYPGPFGSVDVFKARVPGDTEKLDYTVRP